MNSLKNCVTIWKGKCQVTLSWKYQSILLCQSIYSHNKAPLAPGADSPGLNKSSSSRKPLRTRTYRRQSELNAVTLLPIETLGQTQDMTDTTRGTVLNLDCCLCPFPKIQVAMQHLDRYHTHTKHTHTLDRYHRTYAHTSILHDLLNHTKAPSLPSKSLQTHDINLNRQKASAMSSKWFPSRRKSSAKCLSAYRDSAMAQAP